MEEGEGVCEGGEGRESQAAPGLGREGPGVSRGAGDGGSLDGRVGLA